MKFAVVAVKFTQSEKQELLRALREHASNCRLRAIRTESIPALANVHKARLVRTQFLAEKIEKVEPYM